MFIIIVVSYLNILSELYWKCEQRYKDNRSVFMLQDYFGYNSVQLGINWYNSVQLRFSLF